MGLLLDRVFASNNIFDVFGIALVLKSLGAVEVTYNKSKRRFTNMVCVLANSLTASNCRF